MPNLNPSLNYLLILNQAPVLIVCVIGLILARVFWTRYPRPCAYSLIACLLLLLPRLAEILNIEWYFFLFIQSASPGGLSSQPYLSIVWFASSLVHAVGLALLLAAVFIGRSSDRTPPLASEKFDRPIALPVPGSQHIKE